MLSHVDLCSGIGGFALGFQWAGLSKPVLFCDIEPWSRKILKKHWPDVPIATDVKELANDPDGLIPRTDPKRTILTAGYPCQPFSHAGKRLGHADDRHIWPYILQIVAQKRPAFCCFENVYGHVSLGLDQVLSDLEGQGYATRPFIVPACATDAPHRRDRVWIIGQNVAHTESQRLQGQRRELGLVSKREAKHTTRRGGKEVRARKVWLTEPSVGRVADGIPKRVDRLKGLGNAIVPQIAMKIGEAIKASIDA
jgi:DNA (cytosine-5)-methyltransferase 1